MCGDGVAVSSEPRTALASVRLKALSPLNASATGTCANIRLVTAEVTSSRIASAHQLYGEVPMIDEIAIQQTLNRYSEGASRADWKQVMATFTKDAIWEIQSMGARFQDHAVIQKAMSDFIGQMAYFVQVNSPAIIAVDGDKATARSIIRECGKFADRDEALEILGRYSDELIRTPEGWKFTRRVFEAIGQHRFKLLPRQTA
jgi:ketosteroid isomerase-like protein